MELFHFLWKEMTNTRWFEFYHLDWWKVSFPRLRINNVTKEDGILTLGRNISGGLWVMVSDEVSKNCFQCQWWGMSQVDTLLKTSKISPSPRLMHLFQILELLINVKAFIAFLFYMNVYTEYQKVSPIVPIFFQKILFLMHCRKLTLVSSDFYISKQFTEEKKNRNSDQD